MKLFSTIFSLILLLLCVTFAVSNRQTATISLWPFDMQVEAPLYLLTLGVLLFGLLAGAVLAWLNMLPHHFEARRLRKDIGHLSDRLEEMQRAISIAPRGTGDNDFLPPPKKPWQFWKNN